MEFVCEDLPEHGVVLVPPSSPDYDVLISDIQARLDQPVAGSPPRPQWMRSRIPEEDRETSAILVNRSQTGIVGIQQVWLTQDIDGRTSSSSISPGANPSVLLPFGVPEKTLRLFGYWHVILPGSKRYMNMNGDQIGNNSDVRPPAPDEMCAGGTAGAVAGAYSRGSQLKKVTLTIDGVFFTNGGFAGPNQKFLWEQVYYAAEAYIQVSTLARQEYDPVRRPRQYWLASRPSWVRPAHHIHVSTECLMRSVRPRTVIAMQHSSALRGRLMSCAGSREISELSNW